MQTKPPLGLRPEHMVEELNNKQRIIEIAEAIERYASCSKAIPYGWTVELNRRLKHVP